MNTAVAVMEADLRIHLIGALARRTESTWACETMSPVFALMRYRMRSTSVDEEGEGDRVREGEGEKDGDGKEGWMGVIAKRVSSDERTMVGAVSGRDGSGKSQSGQKDSADKARIYAEVFVRRDVYIVDVRLSWMT